jgi:hypothetical protein
MDVESRKSEEKDTSKKVDLEIEVRCIIGLGPAVQNYVCGNTCRPYSTNLWSLCTTCDLMWRR